MAIAVQRMLDSEHTNEKDAHLRVEQLLKTSNSVNMLNSLEELLKNRIKFVPAKRVEVEQEIPFQAINVAVSSYSPKKSVLASSGGPPSSDAAAPVASTSKLPSLKGKGKDKAGSDGFVFSSEFPRNYGAVVSGMENYGNTCYLNSTLQALVHTPSLVHALLQGKAHPPDTCKLRQQNKLCALCELQLLMVRAFERKTQSGGPRAITSRLRAIASHLRIGRQEDAHEFLRFFMDAMQTGCLAAYGPNQLKANPSLKESTLVHQIFGGRFRSRVQCSRCQHCSDTFDTMLDLSLDIANCSHIKQSFEKFVKPDHLRGANKYKCEKCKKLVEATKSLSLDRAPNVLTIHMKRFTPTGRKLAGQIAFDEWLSIGPIMSEDDEDPRYRLDGIINHSGSGPHSGHYYSYCRGSDNAWYRLDDSNATRISSGVRSVLGVKTAYMLIYTRIDKDGAAPTPRTKRKYVEEEEEDVGETVSTKSPKAFIGPVRPTASTPVPILPPAASNPFTMRPSPQVSSPEPTRPLGERVNNHQAQGATSYPAQAPNSFYGGNGQGKRHKGTQIANMRANHHQRNNNHNHQNQNRGKNRKGQYGGGRGHNMPKRL